MFGIEIINAKFANQSSCIRTIWNFTEHQTSEHFSTLPVSLHVGPI